ncbi:MAG: hypothetical protein ACRDLF_14945 [Solirubrobacteraceae bacterium]
MNAAPSKQQTAIELATWLYHVHPELFAAAYVAARTGRAATLGDFSDILDSVGSAFSSVGSGLEGAVSSVGSWLSSSQGLTTLSSLGTAYLNNQAQQNVLQTQIARTQALQSPLAVTYTQAANGSIVPVLPYSSTGVPITYSGTMPQPAIAGYVPASSSVLQSLTPSMSSTLSEYLPYILIGLAVGVPLLLLRS